MYGVMPLSKVFRKRYEPHFRGSKFIRTYLIMVPQPPRHTPAPLAVGRRRVAAVVAVTRRAYGRPYSGGREQAVTVTGRWRSREGFSFYFFIFSFFPIKEIKPSACKNCPRIQFVGKNLQNACVQFCFCVWARGFGGSITSYVEVNTRNAQEIWLCENRAKTVKNGCFFSFCMEYHGYWRETWETC